VGLRLLEVLELLLRHDIFSRDLIRHSERCEQAGDILMTTFNRDRDPNLIFSIAPKLVIICCAGPYHSFMMPTATTTLRASLERHNDTFESLLRLIPAQYYIVNEETEEQVSFLSKLIPEFLRHRSSGCFKIPEAQQETKDTQAGHKRGLKES